MLHFSSYSLLQQKGEEGYFIALFVVLVWTLSQGLHGQHQIRDSHCLQSVPTFSPVFQLFLFFHIACNLCLVEKKIISNCSLLMCQSSGIMKKNYSLAWFSTSLGRGIVVPSINIMCNILKITSQYLIPILALLSCPILMWCPDYLLHLLCFC